MAERARAELAGAVHPADDAAGGEIVGDPLDERARRRARRRADRLPAPPARAPRRRPPGPRTDDRARRGRGCRSRCGRRRAPRRARSRRRRARAARTRARSRTRARMRALATPFSATPPPKQRSGSPVSCCSARAMSTSVSSSTRWTLAAQSAKRRPSAVSRSIGSYGRRGGPKRSTNLRRIRSRRRRLELEVLGHERERAVRRAADHLADLVDHRRPAVGGEPHHLVLVLVDREAEVGGERRVEHAERVRESDLARAA